MTINLTTLKAAAELAKTSPLNRDEWGEDIDPDDVLRLVEAARLARKITESSTSVTLGELLEDLHKCMEGIDS